LPHIFFADALSNPNAMVVKSIYASFAYFAMFSAFVDRNLTLLTVAVKG
jgi:hypothetical protein